MTAILKSSLTSPQLTSLEVSIMLLIQGYIRLSTKEFSEIQKERGNKKLSSETVRKAFKSLVDKKYLNKLVIQKKVVFEIREEYTVDQVPEGYFESKKGHR